VTPENPDTTPSDSSTGLPGVRSWRIVYAAVFTVFLIWVALLTWLTHHFTS